MLNSIQGAGSMRPMGGMQAPKPLTDDQKAQVKDILSKYDSSSISATDAKSIFKAFQEAGIKGPGLRDAIKEAGVDSEQLFALGHEGRKPPQGGPPPAQGGSSKINAGSLQTLQQILEQYDLSSLNSEDEESILSQLNNAGLLNSGSMIDLQA